MTFFFFSFCSIDEEEDEETREAMRNLVLLVASLTFCGHTQLKLSTAATSTTLYQLESFEIPEPQNKGSTVRNVLAFQVLQSVFLKSKSEYLDGNVLDAVSTIFTADNANYFLLENLNFLPQVSFLFSTLHLLSKTLFHYYSVPKR